MHRAEALNKSGLPYNGFCVHPVIRLSGFLALCVLLARAAWVQAFTAAVLLGLFYHLAEVPLRTGLTALKRLRWLLISLVLIHLAFTPGVPVFPGLLNVPTLQGLEDGLLRAALLILLMLAAHLLMQSTARGALLAALLWFSAPLARLGFARERLALRVMLTLQAVAEVQNLMVHAAAPDDAQGRASVAGGSLPRIPATHRDVLVSREAGGRERPPATLGHPARHRTPGATQHSTRLARIAQRASLLWENVLQRAENAPCVTLDIPACGAPPLRQWCYLLLAAALFWALGTP
ncbi:MAG: hypothetical protein C4528_02645 [Gammaproteobacteria bacterium]|nr:MAG: hypothetical protein C4528_02645 [Gammaproteobacteria bacterium]